MTRRDPRTGRFVSAQAVTPIIHVPASHRRPTLARRAWHVFNTDPLVQVVATVLSVWWLWWAIRSVTP